MRHLPHFRQVNAILRQMRRQIIQKSCISVTTILDSGGLIHKIMSQYNLTGISSLNEIPKEQISCMI